MIPTGLFLTHGVGHHREKLQSFELALRDAGIAHLNLVSVSSIVPPGCEILSRDRGLARLLPGQITYVVLARNETDEPHRLLSASVGLALPSREGAYGYISEHHAFGQTSEATGDYAEDLAATMLATTMGVKFDPDADWDQKKQAFHTGGLTIRTTNATQSAKAGKDSLWTTVMAAAVFVP